MADDKCSFDMAWRGPCGEPASLRNRCPAHAEVVCAACKSPATRECDYTGQFVCGTPLCDNCHGYTDTSKPSGSWGFLNHSHCRKQSHVDAAKGESNA